MRVLSIVLLTCFFISANAQTPGIITDTIKCQANPKQNYVLYLPKNYVSTNKYPLLLFFEPAARPQLPIKNYSDLADRYQLIMACSYQSRNGPYKPSIDAAYAMLSDITTRFSISAFNIFLSGFSGGARLATFLAIHDNQFAGVIACGATFPPGGQISKEDKIPYAMLIGDHDMNYLESMETATYLAQIQNPFTKIEFRGGHRWPDADKFEEALVWQLMKNGLLEKDRVQYFYRQDLQKVIQQIDSGNWYNAQLQASKLACDYNGIIHNSKGDSLLTALTGNENYQKEKKKVDKILKLEQEWLNKFHGQYQHMMLSMRPDTAFRAKDWTPYLQEFNKLRNSKETSKQLAGEGLLEFAWRIGAEQGRMAFKDKDYPRALLNAQISALFAPDNPNSWFTLARIKAAQGENKESIQFLKKAFEKGLDKVLVENDNIFEPLRNETGYKKIMSQ